MYHVANKKKKFQRLRFKKSDNNETFVIQIIHFGFNHKICLIVRKKYNGKAYVNAYLNYVPSISKAMGM